VSFVILHFQKENESTMDELIQQVAALEVADRLRRSKRMPMPEAELVLDFSKLACETMGRPCSNNGSEKIRTRPTASFFGAPALVKQRVHEALRCGSFPIEELLVWVPSLLAANNERTYYLLLRASWSRK
jgi:hypothetical protein